MTWANLGLYLWLFVYPMGTPMNDSTIFDRTWWQFDSMSDCEEWADDSNWIYDWLYNHPGYDWIFSQQISGLITKYGGANSHMAIRCAEFDIPAAIGCGEQRYDALLDAKQIMLDCSASLIKMMK